MTKSFIDTMSHFWLMTSIVTSFCSISLICLLNRHFERLNLIFTKYLWWIKLFNKTWGTFWQNTYLIPCRVFDLWRHLLTSFCSISLILPLYRLFEQLDSNFTKYLQGVKLFNMIWGILWKNLFLIQCRVFDSWHQLWRHFALSHQLVYLIAFLSDLTWFLQNIYDESNCLTRPKEHFGKIFVW